MDTQQIISELRSERTRIDQAIGALESLNSSAITGPADDARRRGPRRMNVTARARISAAQKARWAKLKGVSQQPTKTSSTGKQTGTSTQKRVGMSAAARKRLSEVMKKRWAQRKMSRAKKAA